MKAVLVTAEAARWRRCAPLHFSAPPAGGAARHYGQLNLLLGGGGKVGVVYSVGGAAAARAGARDEREPDPQQLQSTPGEPATTAHVPTHVTLRLINIRLEWLISPKHFSGHQPNQGYQVFQPKTGAKLSFSKSRCDTLS